MSRESQPLDSIESATDYPGMQPVLSILHKELRTIGIVTAFITGCSLLYAVRAPSIYLATSKIVVQGNAQAKNSMSLLAQVAGFPMPSIGGTEVSRYFPDILEDDDFLLEIMENKWFLRGDSLTLEDYWKLSPDTSKPDWKYRFEKEKLGRLKKGAIKLKQSETGLLVLSTQFDDPQLAYQVNNFVVEQLDRYLLGKMRFSARQSRLFVEQRLKEAENQLKESEIQLTEFMEKNQGVSSPKLLLTMKRLQREITINQEIFLELKKQYEMARIEENKSQPLLDVISRPNVPIYKHKPNRKQIVAAGLFVGLFIGIFIGFFRNWFAVKFKVDGLKNNVNKEKSH